MYGRIGFNFAHAAPFESLFPHSIETMATQTVKIVYNFQSPGGLKKDAEWVKDALVAAGCKGVRMIDSKKYNSDAKHRREFCFMTIFIEHVVGEPSMEPPSAFTFLLVNHEFLYDWDLQALRSARVTALCKTRVAVDVLSSLGIESNYTNFGQNPQKWPPVTKKVAELAIHLAGSSSPLKGTKQLLRVWSERIHHVRPKARLFVTCWGIWAEETLAEWKQTEKPTRSSFKIGDRAVDGWEAKSVFVADTKLDEADVAKFRALAAVHVCNSLTEGWGHVINDARVAGAVVVTVDAPPMNELITKDTGILVPVSDTSTFKVDPPFKSSRNKWYSNEYSPATYKASDADLANGILQGLDSGASSLGDAARNAARNDATQFAQSMHDLWNSPRDPKNVEQVHKWVKAANEHHVGESRFTGKAPTSSTMNYDDDYTFLIQKDDLVLQAALRRGIPFEKYQTAVMSAYVVPGSIVVDVGTNIGTVAIPLSRAAKGNVTVLAFEPFPQTWALLRENIERNRAFNVIPMPVAVGDRARPVVTLSSEVFAPPEMLEKGEQSRKLNLDEHKGESDMHYGAVQLGTGGEPIRMLTVDDLVRRGSVSVLKVDVEGAEPLAFYGARKMIERNKPTISFEFNENVVTPEMKISMGLTDEVANFNIITYCYQIGYRDLYEIEFGNYLIVHPSRLDLVTPNPIWQFRSVKSINAFTSEVTKGYRLHKFQRPVWKKKAKWRRQNALRNKLWHSESQTYSQNGEDGIIAEIFSIIGATDRHYVEFGVEDGSECNTRLLREKDWKGVMFDGGFDNPEIGLHQEFITATNIRELFAKYDTPEELDLVSIDIDGNDYYVWEALCGESPHLPENPGPAYRPRVVVIEYNARFRPPDARTIKYDPEFEWERGSQYMGASAQALWSLGRKLGYTLVYADSNGVNLFFVRDDVLTKGVISGFGKNAAIGNVRSIYRSPSYNKGRGWTGAVPKGRHWIRM